MFSIQIHPKTYGVVKIFNGEFCETLAHQILFTLGSNSLEPAKWTQPHSLRGMNSRLQKLLQTINCSSYFHVNDLKGIVHFEIKIWYLSAYPKGIQDVGVFFSSVDPILIFLGQTVLVCQSYNGRYRSLSL